MSFSARFEDPSLCPRPRARAMCRLGRAFARAAALFAAVLFAAVLCVGAAATPCFAQQAAESSSRPPPSRADQARAEALFKSARELMKDGDYESACPKLEESQRIDPGTGTLLNLGDCYEKAGKLASAWATYELLLPEAQRLNQADRIRYASERREVLGEKLSRLTIEIPAGSSVPGLTIELDGERLSAASVGEALPVDGGTHTVKASAPNYLPWSEEVTLTIESDAKTVSVPPLEPAPAPEAALVAPAASTATAPPPVEADSGARPQGTNTAVYIAGGATAVLALGAGITGGIALGKAARFDEANMNPARTEAEREDLRDSAKSMALVSTIFTGAAIVGAGVTVYLLVSDSSGSGSATTAKPRRTARARLTPWLGPDGAGLAVAGSL